MILLPKVDTSKVEIRMLGKKTDAGLLENLKDFETHFRVKFYEAASGNPYSWTTV
jgi:hypothetical protein